MKISELITALEQQLEAHGDIVVFVTDGDCCGCACGPIHTIEVWEPNERYKAPVLNLNHDKYRA